MEPIITQEAGNKLGTALGLLIVSTGALTTDYDISLSSLPSHHFLHPLQATPLLLF